VLDLAILAANYRKCVTVRLDSKPTSTTTVVDVEDLALLAATTAQSGVGRRPGLRWIRRRSDRVVVSGRSDRVPEPGVLLLSAMGLIGMLGYTWTKRGKAPVC